LVIDTSTTIVTFLMVFLIQHTQNRDSTVLQLKPDELIRAMEGAHNSLLALEELEEQDLEWLRAAHEELVRRACTQGHRGCSISIGQRRHRRNLPDAPSSCSSSRVL
jgi:low affinity Fe/Cu permease